MKSIASNEDHSAAIYALCEGGNGTVFSGAGDRFVVRWNAFTLQQNGFTVKLEEPVFSLAFDEKNNVLYIGTSNGSIHLIDVTSRQEIKHYKIHSAAIYNFIILNKRNEIIAVSGDGTISIWGLANHELIRRIPISPEKIRSIAFHPSEAIIAVGDNEGLVHILETSFYNELYTIHAHEQGVTALAFHPAKPVLLSAGKDAHLNAYNIPNDYSVLTKLPAHKSSIYRIAFSPDAAHFITSSRDKSFKLWDAHQLEVISKMEVKSNAHTHSVNAVQWIDNYHFMTAGDDRRINLISIMD